jgi:hypothetical protein
MTAAVALLSACDATPPNRGLKLRSRLAALAGTPINLYSEALRASAAKAPARSLSPGREADAQTMADTETKTVPIAESNPNSGARRNDLVQLRGMRSPRLRAE